MATADGGEGFVVIAPLPCEWQNRRTFSYRQESGHPIANTQRMNSLLIFYRSFSIFRIISKSNRFFSSNFSICMRSTIASPAFNSQTEWITLNFSTNVCISFRLKKKRKQKIGNYFLNSSIKFPERHEW